MPFYTQEFLIDSKDLTVLSFEYLHDVKNEFTLENIENAPFRIVEEPDLNWGEKNGFYWFRFNLDAKKQKNYVWNLPTIHIDTFALYMKKNDSLSLKGVSGNKIPIYQKSIIYPYSAISSTIDAGRQVFYARVFFKHEANFPIKIVPQKTFNFELAKSLFTSSFYYGVVLMVLLLNLGLYFFFKDLSYLFYNFFLFAIALSIFYDDGLFNYFFPQFISNYDSLEVLFHWLSAIGATLFTFSYLNITLKNYKLQGWFWFLIGIGGVLYVIGEYSNMFYAYRAAGFIIYTVFLSCWILAFYKSFHEKYVRILVIAYILVLFSSMGHYILRVLGFQFIRISPFQIKLGGFIEMILLTVAILYKFRIMQKENIRMKLELINYINKRRNTSEEKEKSMFDFIEKMATTYQLSNREREVLHEVSKHKKNREIAKELCVSIPTVKYHIGNIFVKLDVKSRVDIIEKVENSLLV